ncbi:uncharacterized [Tachysurus ichikawai]
MDLYCTIKSSFFVSFINVHQESVTEIWRPFPERFRPLTLFSVASLLPEEAPAVAVAFEKVVLLDLNRDQFVVCVVTSVSLFQVEEVGSGSACWRTNRHMSTTATHS